ncbi:MAG: ATP-binding protein, partial [Campylobacterota bacterium]|nr:ATP-binding protein [Campylobacterota bacterium]
KQKIKIILLVSVIFIFINLFAFIITNLNKNQRIDIELQKNISSLEDHYNLIMDMKIQSADIIFNSIVTNQDIIDILSKANYENSKKKMADLRKELLNSLENKFKFMKKRGIKLGLITLPNNKVFLRLHNPSKFDDDISNVRYSITQVNKEHKIVRGFEKGKISHALRNIYPIFDKNGNFIGSFDISYDISMIEDKLLNVSEIQSHLIIHKDILESRVIGYTGKELNYIQSLENKDFKIRIQEKTHNDKNYHNFLKDKSSLLSRQIENNMKLEKEFALYFQSDDKIKVVSFYPINNIKENKTVAWLISHKESNFINTTLMGVTVVRGIIFISSFLLIYFVYRTLIQRNILDKKVQKQTKELKISNKKLKELTEYQEVIIEGQIKLAIEERDKARNLAKVKSEFLANMSHEIRTPLNAITGFIDILKEECKGRKAIEYVEVIDKSSQSLLQIIEDILDFSKIESGKLNIDKIYFNTREEFIVITDLFSEKCSKKNIQLNVNINENMPEILNTDPLRVKQIISNLLSNAIKFTDEYKSIYVDIMCKDQRLFVSVRDEGKGISSDKLEYIFEEFNQEDSSTTRKYGGTGLGLTISSKLVGLLGGELKVKSQLGKGSEFYFSIPARVGKPTKQNGQIKKENHSFNKEKVLVVEDNKSNQMLMKILLKKMNLSFEFANDGVEAVEAFKSNRYDIILMDENMPNLNGIEATKQLLEYEKQNNLTHTPIVALTANALKGDRERFLEAGMDEYLSKPVSKVQLNLILVNLLQDK